MKSIVGTKGPEWERVDINEIQKEIDCHRCFVYKPDSYGYVDLEKNTVNIVGKVNTIEKKKKGFEIEWEYLDTPAAMIFKETEDYYKVSMNIMSDNDTSIFHSFSLIFIDKKVDKSM